jgi:HK97 family phage major capsid protein
MEPDEIKEVQEVLKQGLKDVKDQTQQAMDQALHEVKTLSAITTKTNEELVKLGEKSTELQARILDAEQKADAALKRHVEPEARGVKTPGQLVAESDEWRAAAALGSRAKAMDAVALKTLFPSKTAIVNATGASQPLVPADRVAMVMPSERQLTIRSLIPTGVTGSNVVEYARENVFTNSAAPQYSSPNRENVAKAESGITFTLESAAVITVAHWIPASRQVLSDAGMLMGYIDNRLTYGLKLEEEDEILNGDGTGGTLDGLMNQATAYSGAVSGDQRLDTILRALLQVTTGSEYVGDGVVLSHVDWAELLLLKDTQGRYLFGDPSMQRAPMVWGRPVVPTNSMATGSFLVGAFQLGAQVWDREDANIRISESHSDFFVKNMVAILCEERLALTVYRPLALVTGTF